MLSSVLGMADRALIQKRTRKPGQRKVCILVIKYTLNKINTFYSMLEDERVHEEKSIKEGRIWSDGHNNFLKSCSRRSH